MARRRASSKQAAEKSFVFIETSAFTAALPSYLDDERYRALQNMLMASPEAGDVIRGAGGLRKVRFADPRRGKGKGGGLRVIYFYFVSEDQIALLAIYDKDEMDDLTPQERRALAEMIKHWRS